MPTKPRAKAKTITKRAATQPTSMSRALDSINQATNYGVRVVEAVIPVGTTYWRVVGVRHLTPEENRGKHNIYVDAQDEAGQRDHNPALRLAWTWDGRQPDQPAEPKPLDKPANEPASNLDMYGAQYQVWIAGDGLPSDRVENLRTDHPDEQTAMGEMGNSQGHHSFHVTFQRTRKMAVTHGGDAGLVTSTTADTNGVTKPTSEPMPQVGDDKPVAPLQAPIPLIFTNQDLINAFASAAASSGLSQWALLEKAGFDVHVLAQDREGLFPGPTLEQMPNLTDSERTSLRRELLAWLLKKVRWIGLTNAQAGVNLRSGPSTAAAAIAGLAHETTVQVLGQVDEWLFVVANGEAGYLRRDLVVARVEPVILQPEMPTPLRVQPIRVPANASAETLTVATAWNRFGDIIWAQANQLGIDPGIAVAVLAAEAGGVTHGADGRMLIRFENHIFYEQWGQANEAVYREHFRFDPLTPWQGHQWNAGDGQWHNVHIDSQEGEWAAFTFARALDERAAMYAISMGAPQIMGFNHAAIGYSTVQAMFQTFQADASSQIKGFFAFVQAKNAVAAIRAQDFLTFATLYNGSGQAATYETIIRRRLALFQALTAVPAAARGALAPTAPLAPAGLSPEPFAQWRQQLLFVTQLSIIQQTYWLRLAAVDDPGRLQQTLTDATNDAIRQLTELQEKS